jgi:hypothetical protein
VIYKSAYFPKKEYSSKEDMFDDFRKNIDSIIDFKKSEIHKSCEKGLTVTCKSLDLLKFTDQLKGIKIDDGYYYIATNSTLILDSHEDFHLNGLWAKSVKEQQGKNYLVADHDLSIDKVIVRKEHIEMFTAKLPFALLGYPYDGETEVLIYKFPKDKVVHEKVKQWLDSGDSIEASVRMQYVTIEFAMDSNAPEDVTLKKNYDTYLPMIANKAEFEYIPYYFIIKEAKNVRESSLVIFGSNPVTGNIQNTEPEKSTHKTDPPKEQSKSYYSLFLN